MTTQQAGNGFTTIPVEDGAEGFVEMLNSNGSEHLFINSGTDTFPILEAITRMTDQERAVPKVVLCIDESTAMFAAQGYFQLTGKPQTVLVHVDAGTVQIGGAYHDAQRDRDGIVVCAGRSPATFGSGLAGARDMGIHWIQEQRDQGGIVRTFTKWDYELRNLESLNWAVQKAFQVSTTEPAGPVYLTLPRELLMQRMEELRVPPSARHAKPSAPAPDPGAIVTLADWLVSAQRPLIITSFSGRHPGTVAHLVALAEAVGAPVVGAIETRLNFPTLHPLNAATCGAPSVQDADVILVIDSDTAWIPSQDTLEPKGKVAWIDVDPTKDTIPLWTYPADLLIHAASQHAVPALVDAVRDRLTAADKARIAERAERYAANTAAERKRLEGLAASVKSQRPLHPLWVAHCLEQVLEQDTIVMNEGMTGSWPWLATTDRREPGTVFASGGASLGYALGAAVGAKLANPGRDVVALEGDGSFVFARPTSAFWAADKYNTPFLTVIYNNSRHQATVNSWNNHMPESVGRRTGQYAGVDIDPSPEYALIAQASRGYGERVEEPDDVLPALRRGLARVREGQAAVLDMRIARMDGRRATRG